MRAIAPSPSAPSPLHAHCEACNAWVLPIRPHWGWRAAEITFWLSLPALLVVFKALGVILMPFMLVVAGGLAGPLRSKASTMPSCPQCERDIVIERRR